MFVFQEKVILYSQKDHVLIKTEDKKKKLAILVKLR